MWKKLFTSKNELLKKDEIICPYTDEVINATKSFTTTTQAKDFMVLVVSLTQLAGVKNENLNNFINAQERFINERRAQYIIVY